MLWELFLVSNNKTQEQNQQAWSPLHSLTNTRPRLLLLLFFPPFFPSFRIELGWFRSSSSRPQESKKSPEGSRKILGFLGGGKSDYVDPRPAYQASIAGREDYKVAVLIPNKGLYVLSVLAFAPMPIIEPESTVEYVCPVYNSDHYSVGLRIGAKVGVVAVRCDDKAEGFYPFPEDLSDQDLTADGTPTRARGGSKSSAKAGGSRSGSRTNSRSGSRRGSSKSKARQGSNKSTKAPTLPAVPSGASSGDDDEVPPTPPPGPIRAPDVSMADVERVVSPALIRALTPKKGSKPTTPTKPASDLAKPIKNAPLLDIEPEDSEPESDTSPMPVTHARMV